MNHQTEFNNIDITPQNGSFKEPVEMGNFEGYEPIGDEFIKKLEALREMTKLNPIAYVKVLKARREAEQLRDLYIKYEPNDIIGVDYSVADDLEYSLRKRALERSVERDWIDYLSTEHDGIGLSEYADGFIDTHIRSKQGIRR